MRRWRRIQKMLAWGFWAANGTAIILFWLTGDAWIEVASGDWVVVLHAVGRLLGLLATFCALTQFVLMGRVGWLEPIFGLDRLAIFHRRNGVAALTLILLHSSIIASTHGALEGKSLLDGIATTLNLPFVWLAVTAELLLITTVGMSIYIVRKHLKFETWYAVHLFNYAAIAIVPFHQFANGGDLLGNPALRYYWLGLYTFVALHVVLWRVGKPLLLLSRHQFKVQRLVHQTATATSVYITGHHMDKFHAKGGQFVLVRFLDRRFMWQEHPFSLSRLPSAEGIRLTIRQLGDYTTMIPQLPVGTRAWISGPFGAFTHDLMVTNKIVYIAGGIGITPIRAMIEAQTHWPTAIDSVMLYGNRSLADTIFMDELKPLAARLRMPIYNVLSDQPGYAGETGFVDKEKISRLVPDVTKRDVFLCGPPPMMWGIIAALRQLGVPNQQIHYERFALHKD